MGESWKKLDGDKGVHTYIVCSGCGHGVRSSRHTVEECKENIRRDKNG